MPTDVSITTVAHVIQLAVAPVFLLTGVGTILSVMTSRLSRIIDRFRVLEMATPNADEVASRQAEMTILANRERVIYWAISLCTVSALLICVVIVTLFVGSVMGVQLTTAIALLFIAAMLALIGGFLTLLREIFIATSSIHRMENKRVNLENPIPEKNSAVPTTKTRKWLRRGLELLVIIVIIFGVRAWQQRDIVKGAAPALSGLKLDGTSYTFAAKPGQPVLVHFWATWCPICRAEQGSIESLAHDNPNVITVAMQSGKNEIVQQFMHEQSVSFPVINDADGQLSEKWGVRGVPASFIIDTEGKVRFVEIGYTTGWGLRFRLWLASL